MLPTTDVSLVTGVTATADPWSAVALAIAVVFGVSAILLVAHELAHALAAELRGCRVAEVSLGTGPIVATMRPTGVRIIVRVLPLAGHTRVMPDTETPWVVIVGAGPGVDLLVAATGFAIGGPFGMALGVAGALTFVANVVPWRRRGGDGTGSDGRRLLELARHEGPDPAARERLRAVLEALRLLELGDVHAARAWIEHGRSGDDPDPALATIEVFVELAHLDHARARSVAARLLGDPALPDAARPTIQNALAWADLLLDDPGLVSEALTASEAAIRARPGDRAIQGTRGWALIEAGRPAEGVALCRRSMRARVGRAGRDVTRCTLAIGLAREGRLNAAEQQLRAAGRREAGSELFVRARREVDRAWALLPAEQVTDVVV